MTKFVNLTPHPINIIGGPVIPPSGEIARVQVTREFVGRVGMVDCFRPIFGDPEGVPDPEPGTILIVSGLVRAHPDFAGRGDIASPGDLVRGEGGAVVGCNGLDFNVQPVTGE